VHFVKRVGAVIHALKNISFYCTDNKHHYYHLLYVLQDLKRHVWSSGEDPVGIFNSDIKPASPEDLEPPDYGNQVWTYEGRQKILKSSESTSKCIILPRLQ
jgi:hypothetical protein